MDFKHLSLVELKKLREECKTDLADLKNELKIVNAALLNPRDKETVKKLDKIRIRRISKLIYSSTDESDVEPNVSDPQFTVDLLQYFTNISVNDISVDFITEEEQEWFLYKVNANINTLKFNIDFESNQEPTKVSVEDSKNEIIRKLNITILEPNLQEKVQNGIDFFANNPSYIKSAMLFLKKLNHLYDIRKNVVKKLLAEDKYIDLGMTKRSEQYVIVFKSPSSDKHYLQIQWSLKWEPQTCLACDGFAARIIMADTQFLEEVKPLIEKLCSDKFTLECTEKSKYDLLEKILIFIKAADARNESSDYSSSS